MLVLQPRLLSRGDCGINAKRLVMILGENSLSKKSGNGKQSMLFNVLLHK